MASKKTARFNHDYIHCNPVDCDRKDDCVNYLAYQEALELGLKDIKVAPHCKNIEIDYVRVRIEK
jgi:hypothetical protein